MVETVVLKDAFRTFEHLTFEFQKKSDLSGVLWLRGPKKTVRLNGKSDLNGARLNRTILA